jgi:hypothetical protein
MIEISTEIWQTSVLEGYVLVVYLISLSANYVENAAMKMEAARSFETLVTYHTTTRRHNLKMEASRSLETLVSYDTTTLCQNL